MTKIIADSSCDIFQMEGADFAAAPMLICTDEKTYTDDKDLNITEMLDHLASLKEKTGTSCPSPDSWIRAFGEADTIFIATLTSALSGTFHSAQVARELYLQTHPHAKIHVFDSRSTGPELLLLVEKLAELTKQGLDFSQICQKAETYLQKTRLICSLSSLHNMAQNGRVSKVLAKAVGILGLRIIITASTEGTLEPIEKSRGDKKAMDSMLQQMMKAGYSGGKVRINHTENPSAATALREKILSKFPHADVLCYAARGLCSYYAERGSVMMGFETV